MDTVVNTPDAPFRSGTTGKYKLLIRSVSPKVDGYEYELVDADSREYKARFKIHYPEGQLLRCIVTFEVRGAKLVVTDTAICKKQDLTTPFVKPKKERIVVKAPTNPIPVKTVVDKQPEAGIVIRTLSETEIHELLTQIARKKGTRNPSYYCCDKKFKNLYEFRRHLYGCHPIEYNQYFVTELHQTFQGTVRGVGIKIPKSPKRKKGSSKNDDAYPTRCKGDYFRLIYTPMGNKR